MNTNDTETSSESESERNAHLVGICDEQHRMLCESLDGWKSALKREHQNLLIAIFMLIVGFLSGVIIASEAIIKTMK